ncbi:putative mitogen-activated protein kinase kinase kinase STE-STE11 family [Helianthus debilis subsp. tardiflorus]
MIWVRGKTIGQGSFAAVSLAKPTKQSSNLPSILAVKSCALSQSESLQNEKMVLEELKDCPEIIRCYGDSITVENGVKLYNVALEYASGGALSEKVKKSGNLRLPENEVRRVTKSVLNGLDFIHGNGFVHCDIKLQNILLDSNGAVKIADFGLAKKITPLNNLNSPVKWGIRGTPIYMSPEMVTGGEQGPAADVWAVGCMVAEMITGEPVWKCCDFGALWMKIGIGGEIPEIPGKLLLSDEGKDFLGKCFLKDPRERWTAEMLLRHPFVNSVVECEEDAENQISPRDPFDFFDWEVESERSVMSDLELELEFELSAVPLTTRLGGLMTCQQPDWSVSGSWLKVR